MKYDLTKEIMKAKEDDMDSMVHIIEIMNPLIQKYIRKLYFMDQDDAYQEMVLKLIELVKRIPDYSEERRVLSYFSKGFRNYFNTLCTERIYLPGICLVYDEHVLDSIPSKDEVDKIIFAETIKKFSEQLNEQERIVIYMLFIKEVGAADIARELGVSRQYIHKVKKRVLEKWFIYVLYVYIYENFLFLISEAYQKGGEKIL